MLLVHVHLSRSEVILKAVYKRLVDTVINSDCYPHISVRVYLPSVVDRTQYGNDIRMRTALSCTCLTAATVFPYYVYYCQRTYTQLMT